MAVLLTWQVLLEDSVAVVGVGIAAASISLTHVTGNPAYDAIGSIAVGTAPLHSWALRRPTKHACAKRTKRTKRAKRARETDRDIVTRRQ